MGGAAAAIARARWKKAGAALLQARLAAQIPHQRGHLAAILPTPLSGVDVITQLEDLVVQLISSRTSPQLSGRCWNVPGIEILTRRAQVRLVLG